MPTPTRVFAQVAARHGGVDPTDMEAVREWYANALQSLSREQIEAVLSELLSHEGAEAGPEPPRHYPEPAPPPTLDESPPVGEPSLATLLHEIVRRLRPLRRG